MCAMEHFQIKYLQTLSILGHIRRLSTSTGSLSLSLKNALSYMPFPPRGGQTKRRGSIKWRSRELVVGFREYPDIGAPEALRFPSMLIPTDGRGCFKPVCVGRLLCARNVKTVRKKRQNKTGSPFLLLTNF